ncbi:MAG: GNAT family N-acetyltransferase [Pirellulaceae bacterium]|nr:GNAT family N-acetyltransferase [Pirellulaceae bacterium]
MDRRKHPAEVWLHGDDDGNVVAFSSLAGATWKKYDRPISLIPNVAVATPHQGKGYFSEILKFLFTRARNDEDRINAVGLYVHPQNVNAISLYEHKGFHKTGDTWKDKETGVKYVQMAVHI